MACSFITFRGRMSPSQGRLPSLPGHPPQRSLYLFSFCFSPKHIGLTSYLFHLLIVFIDCILSCRLSKGRHLCLVWGLWKLLETEPWVDAEVYERAVSVGKLLREILGQIEGTSQWRQLTDEVGDTYQTPLWEPPEIMGTLEKACLLHQHFVGW